MSATLGLIPAHAGKTVTTLCCPITPWAHPRSRGENPAVWVSTMPTDGSSPLTRGKLGPAGSGKSSLGLIPAHAGKTSTNVWTRWSPRAHPRSRGENFSSSGICSMRCGSSPLTRGKPVVGASGWVDEGLIPAHAGKTPQSRAAQRRPWAHPRSRGENRPAARRFLARLGSSPLTRGKRAAHLLRLDQVGLIPAHAGKTSTHRSPPITSPAHPRSRGENVVEPVWTNVSTGSSPLTRGKPQEQGGVRADLRAHPRSRGENGRGGRSRRRGVGSSPLTRGKHFLTCAFTAQIGQILESLELCASSESYSSPDAYATDAP